MKTVQTFFLLALVAGPAWGSNAKVDSLKQVLEHHATADKAEVLWSIAYELFDVDNTQALFYAERAYHDVWKRGDSLQIVKVGTTYGQLLRRMGKIDRSIMVSSQMLPIAKRHDYRKYWKMLLNSLGVAYAFHENFGEALEYQYEFLSFLEAANDQEGIALALHNLGFIMYKLNDYENAIEYELKSLKMAKEFDLQDLMSNALLNIGAAHLNQENYDSARYYATKSFEIVARNRETMPQAPQLQLTAYSLFGLSVYDSALYYSRQGAKAAIKEGNPWSLGFCYNLLSRIYLKIKLIDKSRVLLDMADSVARASDYPYMKLEVFRQEGRYQAAIGNMDSAIVIIDRYYDLNDSLYHGKKEAAVRNVQLKYDQRENRRQIALQSSILDVQERYLGEQRIMIWVVSILLGIVIFLSLALYSENRKKQLVNELLDQRVIERTKELRGQRDVLQYFVDSQRIKSTKIASELNEILSSIDGLFGLATIDEGANFKNYANLGGDAIKQARVVLNKLNSDDSLDTKRLPANNWNVSG